MSPPAANDSDAPGAASAVVPVLLPLPLGGAYSYVWSEERLGTAPEPGRLVRVPLGQRSLVGAVWEAEVDPVPPGRLRAVEAVVPLPPLPPALRRLVDWVAAYVMAPPGAVLRMVLASPGALEPEPLRQGVRLAEGGTGSGALRPTAARGRVLTVAADGLARTPVDLAREAGVSPSVVAGLIEAGALERVAWSEGRDHPAFTNLPSGPTLSRDQEAVAHALCDSVGAGFGVSLIDGVTGSGKTEVYFEAIAEALRRGRQCLVLLPEIALSAQWLERFEARFGEAPAQWHSDLGPKQRRRTWRAVAEGRVRVLVGARSALFLPFPDLGLIVVDEEHDGAFKQEEGTVYQARDMAVVRGQLEAVPVVLASATPSIETLVNCRLHRYRRLHLPERHGGATLPRVELVDLRRDPPPPLAPREPGWLSPPLREAVRATLDAGEQALLFLNRRGFAPLTLCRTCGHRFQCPNCTAWLVEHRLAGRLQCHHCGLAMPLPKTCPGCGDTDSLVPCGPGVERLAAEAAALFPDARRILLSSDSLRGPLAAAALLEQVRTREVDLLIGTQVVAKGHHFPWLTLVGVVDADLGLEGGDLRAAERTFQLLSQVAGRAGREDRPGRVLLQTRSPDHPVLLALAEGDREGFIEAEIDARRRGFLPPFARLAAIIVSAESAEAADGLAAALSRCAPRARELVVLGPAPAPLAILRGRHRRRFLVKAPRSWPLQRTLSDWLSQVAVRGSARVSVDIDPYSFL